MLSAMIVMLILLHVITLPYHSCMLSLAILLTYVVSYDGDASVLLRVIALLQECGEQ